MRGGEKKGRIHRLWSGMEEEWETAKFNDVGQASGRGQGHRMMQSRERAGHAGRARFGPGGGGQLTIQMTEI